MDIGRALQRGFFVYKRIQYEEKGNNHICRNNGSSASYGLRD